MHGRLHMPKHTSGVVYEPEVRTIGALLEPARRIMSIVPPDQPMIVAARIKGDERNKVFPRQHVKLRFAAFSARRMQDIGGEIVHVSAVVFVDDLTRGNYGLFPEGVSRAITDSVLAYGWSEVRLVASPNWDLVRNK